MDNGGKNQRIVRAKSLSRRRRVIENQLSFAFVDFDLAAVLQLAEQYFVGQARLISF